MSNGNKKHVWKSKDWKSWIDNLFSDNNNNNNGTESTPINVASIVDYVARNKGENDRCTIDNYINEWHDEKHLQYSLKRKHCLHYSNNTSNDSNIPYCWFFEKGSNVRQAFMIAPIFANKFKHTKTLMIVRDPFKQMISYSSLDFDTHIASQNKYSNMSILEYMWNFFEKHESFGFIHKQAVLLLHNLTYSNYNLTNVSNNGNGNNIDPLLNSQAMKSFLKTYLYEATVNDTIYLDSGSWSRISRAFTTSMYFPCLVFYLYAYDQAFGYKNWNNFRVIQFEWLYGKDLNNGNSNMYIGLSAIKCWLQTDKDISTNPFENCPIIFRNDKQYFDQMKQTFDNLASKKRNSKTHTLFTGEYKLKFDRFYTPIKQLFVLLLKHRKEILLGKVLSTTISIKNGGS